MGRLESLRVRVNDELVLDAGNCENVVGKSGPACRLRPPATTLFQQLLTYLEAKPDPPKRLSGSMSGREGVAAAALVLRWGSYLALLLDREKPAWSETSPAASRIADEEMARINIEASAGLADWIDLCREDPCGRRYTQLVDRAVYYLPMRKKTSKVTVTGFAVLSQPEIATQIVEATHPTKRDRAALDAERYPSRVFANALVNTAWRNGPVEEIHAGAYEGYPLDRRRLMVAEERKLMAFAAERLALGMTVCRRLAIEEPPRRPWTEQVLPYALAEMLLITPSGWTLTETSRDVLLRPRI